MSIIYKYAIPDAVNHIEMPVGAKILAAQNQHGNPVIWALCPIGVAIETRQIEVLLTGQHIGDHGELFHISTLQLAGGHIIAHVFERRSAW